MGDDQASLTRQDNSSDETRFLVERSLDEVDWSQIASLGANITVFTDTGLACDHTYAYRVRAYRATDSLYSTYSAVASVLTPACPVPPAPAWLDWSATSTQIDLTWHDSSSYESEYRVERSLGGTSGWTEIATVAADVTAHSDTSLPCDTAYFYRVRAYQGLTDTYSDYSPVANATTMLYAPTDLVAGSPTEISITLTWTPISHTGSGGYEVSYSTTSGSPYTVADMTADLSASSYTVTGLVQHTTYYFVVRAFALAGGGQQSDMWSDYTPEASAETLGPPAPVTLNEQEFYAAMSTEIANNPAVQDIDFALVDFAPDALNLWIRTTDGTVGQVTVTVTDSGTGYVLIQIADITVDGGAALDSYVQVIDQELPALLVSTLDALVVQKTGDLDANVSSMTVSDAGISMEFGP